MDAEKEEGLLGDKHRFHDQSSPLYRLHVRYGMRWQHHHSTDYFHSKESGRGEATLVNAEPRVEQVETLIGNLFRRIRLATTASGILHTLQTIRVAQ